MATPTELFIADELPRRPYTNEFPFAAGKTLVTTGVGLEVVAGDAPGEYLDNTFRIKDNDDTTKKIAFQASDIATGQERTITMPNADVDLGKVPTGVTPTYATGRLMVPLADGTSIPLSAFGGTRVANLASPATVLTANGHYLFYADTGGYYTVICALSLPTAPADMTYVRLSNISSISSFAIGAGATIAPGGSDKINGVAATLDITDYLVNYRNAVITLTYSAFSENWTVSVLGDLINPSTIAIYDADKTNSTTLTPVANLTDNRVITLPNADVNLGDLPSVATTNTNNLTNTTARILGGSGGTASKPDAAIITGASCTANGGLSVVLTGNSVNTTLGGAVVQGNYQAVYANQAAVKQSVIIVGQTIANVLNEITNCGSGGNVSNVGDTKYILATKPNGMSNTNGVGIHRITITGSNQITGATYFGFSGEYIVTCSYNGTTTVIDAITTVHTSLRAGVAETFTPSFTLDATTANAALLIGVTTTLGNVRCAGHVESVYS
jgi:hypothetical protein